jgi:hypothetical protein
LSELSKSKHKSLARIWVIQATVPELLILAVAAG